MFYSLNDGRPAKEKSHIKLNVMNQKKNIFYTSVMDKNDEKIKIQKP